MLQPAMPKKVPQDNPFPSFPAKKGPQPPVKAPLDQAMSQMNINDTRNGNGQGRPHASPPRGHPQQMPPPNRIPQQTRADANARQDSGNFEGQGQDQAYNQRLPPNRPLPAQRAPPTSQPHSMQAQPPRRPSDPNAPSQRAFGANTQRSGTMPQQAPKPKHHVPDLDTQERWVEPGAAPGFYDVSSPTYAPPKPSTAGGVRQNAPPQQAQHQPPVPHAAPPQNQHQAPLQQPLRDDIDNLYDDYYGDDDRKSMASNIDMPNFDAMPNIDAKHRRGDSIDNHLVPDAQPRPTQGFFPADSAPAALPPQQNFQQQALRSRSQPDMHAQYANDVYEMPGDAPPMPGLPRANTGFDGGLPNGPTGRGLPPRGTTVDGMQRPPPQPYRPGKQQGFDPRQPPPVQRGYSNDSAFSEPPMNSTRKVSSPMASSNSIPRPGTAAPAPGRAPSDHMGRRPGTAQPLSNPDALPAHPVPVRAGLMQQQPDQAKPPPGARPPPIRQYNSDQTRASIDSQQSGGRRQSAAPHPVTYDELNRLRNIVKTNPSDNATGMVLAKKLIEASTVLSDEAGTADARARAKNREKFIMEGHKTLKKLVANGYPDAMFYLADCYGQGLLGLQVDTKEAFTLYQSAAKGGHAASAYRTAVCCEMGHEEGGGTKRDPLKAVQWYRRAAALGDTPALYKMGMILLKGLLGQQRNFGEAINMLKRAAERSDKDNPHALHELALIYESQAGNERVIVDEAYALQLFHQAADLGYKFSQFRLGQAYEYGLLGVQIDARTSIAWYTRAAAQEEHQSELALSGWYLTGTSGILEQSDTEAYLWARKAACAEPPLPKALFAMGYFTEVGIGCPRSLDEAKRWYGRAAGKFIS
jgi:TPR repeat protein